MDIWLCVSKIIVQISGQCTENGFCTENGSCCLGQESDTTVVLDNDGIQFSVNSIKSEVHVCTEMLVVQLGTLPLNCIGGKKDLMEEYWLKHDALGPYLVCNAI